MYSLEDERKCVARIRITLYDVDESLLIYTNDGRVREARRCLAAAVVYLGRIEAELGEDGLLALVTKGEVA